MHLYVIRRRDQFWYTTCILGVVFCNELRVVLSTPRTPPETETAEKRYKKTSVEMLMARMNFQSFAWYTDKLKFLKLRKCNCYKNTSQLGEKYSEFRTPIGAQSRFTCVFLFKLSLLLWLRYHEYYHYVRCIHSIRRRSEIFFISLESSLRTCD